MEHQSHTFMLLEDLSVIVELGSSHEKVIIDTEQLVIFLTNSWADGKIRSDDY